MHEVVTLQFGDRANYLATHFWNTQESYFTYPTPEDPSPSPSLVDHDIHFRPGIGADGSDTYTPRTLIYDFQSNFGALRKLNALYDALRPDDVVKGLWDGIQQTQTLAPINPIPYQINLEAGLPTPQLHSRDVRYWSDFNRLFFHPRSILPLSQQSLSSTLNAADTWSNGTELYHDTDKEIDLLDRDVRPFAEESDALSAFQIFTSVDDSWGGYTSSYVEALREEYGKKSIWVWAVEDERRVDRTKQYQRLANSAKSMRAMAQTASAYIRLSNTPRSLPGYVQLETGSNWSTTALMCAAVETVTLPARLRNDGGLGVQGATIGIMEDTLNTNSNQTVWTLKARARSSNDTSASSNNYTVTHGNSTSQATDHRIRESTTHSVAEGEASNPEPSSFDITFTPTLPTAQSVFPSLTSRRQHQSDDHIFAQIESSRYFSRSQLPRNHNVASNETNLARLYNSETIVQSYHTPLAFPLLDSYPDDLFNVVTRGRKLQVDAALCTESRTKFEVLGLRDLVAGRFGRGLGLVETDEVEALYDDLTRLSEGFAFGWEGSDGFDSGSGSEDGE